MSVKIPWWKTSFGEEEIARVRKAISQECISQGPITAWLEAEIAAALQVPYAVATTSGSVALLLALMALNIGRDDEVIVPNRTWIATAHAPRLLGAKVVLVDVLPDLPLMDVSQMRRKITSRTRAIIPVHLNGRSVDMAAVGEMAREYGLAVIEDACQALFSRNGAGYLGTQSDCGCFSLGMTKLISTGQGGLVVTRSRETYEKLKLIRNHGVVDNFTDTWNQMGFNFKFTDLMASFGLVQLARAPERIAHVQSVYSRYARAVSTLPFLQWIPVRTGAGELPLYVEVLSSEREKLIRFLQSRGIQIRPALPSLHTSAYLENGDSFPRSEIFARRGMFLPCGPEQPLENVDRVLEALLLYRRS